MNSSLNLNKLVIMPMLFNLANVGQSGIVVSNKQCENQDKIKIKNEFNIEKFSQFSLNKNVKLTNIPLEEKLNNQLFIILNETPSYFKECEVTFETYYDPDESFEQINVLIKISEHDQIDSYFKFVDFAMASASEELSKRIFFSVA